MPAPKLVSRRGLESHLPEQLRLRYDFPTQERLIVMNFGMRAKGLAAVLIVVAMLAGGSGRIIAQDSSTKFKDRYAKWQESHPFTLGVMSYDMAYLPHWYKKAKPGLILDPDMDVFREAGLNLLDDVSMSSAGHLWYPGVRAAHKAKVQYMILGAGWSGLSDFQHRVKWFAGDKNFAGVQLADEPYDPKDQKTFAEQAKWMRAAHPSLLSLICVPMTNQPKWTVMWDVIRPDGMVFQWYPYHTSSGKTIDIVPEMYACLSYSSEFCKERGIGFFVARGASGKKRSDSTLRANTYAALAYGCTGFIDWGWGSNDETTGYVRYQDKKAIGKTKHFEFLAKINAEVAKLGPALIKLKHIRTYHANLSNHNTWAGPLYGFAETDTLRSGKLIGVSGRTYPFQDHLMVGFFRDSNNEEYFMVTNKINSRATDVDKAGLATQVTLTFKDEVTAIERLSRKTGKVERLKLTDHALTFNLPGGTGDLFKYAGGKQFVGIKQ
jgi:hypothetical protein